jgi:intraflagellar transport protein 172
MHDVIGVVSHKLIEIQRYQIAGELHESVDDIQGAIRVYCMGHMYDRARAVSEGEGAEVERVWVEVG